MPMTTPLPSAGDTSWADWGADVDATVRALENSGVSAVNRTGRLTVASADLPADVKATCDYVCTGTNDQTVINQANLRASRPGDGFGGEGFIGVELVGPNFYIGHNGAGITMYPSCALWGTGPGTLIQPFYATSGIDKGAIELVNENAQHVRVADLSIGRPDGAQFNGHGIKFTGIGGGTTSPYELKSGPDYFCWITNVNVFRASRCGVWYAGSSGGARGSQIHQSNLVSCMEYALRIDGSSDSHISQVIATGGGNFARFLLGGGNTKIADCTAIDSGIDAGDAGVTADGFHFSSSRVEGVGCTSRGAGRYGFQLTSNADLLAAGFTAISNQRASGASNGGGFNISGTGCFTGLLAVDNGLYANRQRRNFVLSSAGGLIQGMSILNALDYATSTASQVSGTLAANSRASIVRSNTTVYTG